jgi:transposase
MVGADTTGAGQPCNDEPGDHSALRVDPEKKSLRARERNEAKRAAWREQTRDVDPARFVWIDETGSHLGMTRRYSRAPRGQRAYGTAPGSRGKNRTLIAALTLAGIGPGLLLDEAIDRETFDGYVIHRLVPTLTPGQIVVVDNLMVHYSDRARAAIEACGAQLWYLPAYSPDLNPIEEAFSKVKTFLRSAAPRTTDEHSTAMWAALRAITPQDAAGWFAHAGYLPPRRSVSQPVLQHRQITIAPASRPEPPRTITLNIPARVAFNHLW